jgi:hypothetical protein
MADLAGNQGVDVTELTSGGGSVSIDLTPPALDSVLIESDNAYQSTLARAGDTVTVTLSATENIRPPLVKVATRTAAVASKAGSNQVYEATIFVRSDDDEGQCRVTIAYFDSVGNAGMWMEAAVCGKVHIDLTAPTLPFVKLVSNNDANSAIAKPEETLVLFIQASENISAPTANIGGTPAQQSAPLCVYDPNFGFDLEKYATGTSSQEGKFALLCTHRYCYVPQVFW